MENPVHQSDTVPPQVSFALESIKRNLQHYRKPPVKPITESDVENPVTMINSPVAFPKVAATSQHVGSQQFAHSSGSVLKCTYRNERNEIRIVYRRCPQNTSAALHLAKLSESRFGKLDSYAVVNQPN